MDSHEFTFLSDPINFSKCSGAVLKLVNEPNPSECFSTLILKSRQILFEFSGKLAAWPCPDSGTIFIICQKSELTGDKLTGQISRLQLEMTCVTSPGPLMVDCLTYTLRAMLSPHWNTVGDWLVAGRQFLQNINPSPSVKMKVNVTEDRLEVTLKATNVSFPLLKPDDLGLDPRLTEAFVHADKSAAMTEEDFGRQYVVVLPKLTRAKLVSVVKCLPSDSRFSDWPAMKRYWKNMYGYRLGDQGEPIVYYNVSFFGKTQLTYPEWTVRRFSPRPVPRSDPRPICEQFIKDLVRLNKTICGERFSMQKAPVVRKEPFIQSTLADTSVSLNWPVSKPGDAPYREVVIKPKEHPPVWKDTVLPNPVSAPTMPVKSQVKGIQDDSGYGTGTEDTLLDCTKSSEKIKPVFTSRKAKHVADSRINVEPRVQTENRTTLKPNFLSKMLASNNVNSFAVRKQEEESATKNSVPAILQPMGSIRPSIPSVKVLPPSKLGASKPMFSVDFSKLRTSAAGDASHASKLKTNVLTSKVAPKETATTKKTLVSIEDIGNLVSSNKVKELTKVNVPSLLAYCRRVGVTEARAKSKKEDLVKWILNHHNTKTK